ncbi:Maltase 1 [Temnothorax longispinosus]|uniref:Maltase 1 n=1 Tax=Temnothorax longispinosus TaxID=300112 RepID=A0A4S2KB22_9HYME|nr:Maltase 1 [Temnothorax longispinosus]
MMYQVYLRSFKNSNRDGIGDLNYITSRLKHITDIGADALWLPQFDFGYDTANYIDVDKDYDALTNFDKLVAKTKVPRAESNLRFRVKPHLSQAQIIQKKRPTDQALRETTKLVECRPRPRLGMKLGTETICISSTLLRQISTIVALHCNLDRNADVLALMLSVTCLRMYSIHYLDKPRKNVPRISDDDYETFWITFTREIFSRLKNFSRRDNRDNHHATSRFDESINFPYRATILSGVSVIYNGDEISTLDKNFTYVETKDPIGCVAGPDRVS